MTRTGEAGRRGEKVRSDCWVRVDAARGVVTAGGLLPYARKKLQDRRR